MDSTELKSRTKTFAVNIVRFVEGLRRDLASDAMAKQIIRSATSVAANYRAACRARSKADFANKMGIVEEEADETLFWLEMLIECKKARVEELTPMMDKAEQLLRDLRGLTHDGKGKCGHKVNGRVVPDAEVSTQSAVDPIDNHKSTIENSTDVLRTYLRIQAVR